MRRGNIIFLTTLVIVILLVGWFFLYSSDELEPLEKREKLIEFVWSGNGLPTKMPDDISRDVSGAWLGDMNNLKQIDILTVQMDYEIDSVVHHFIPLNSNGRLFIYHEGHQEKEEGEKTIQFLVQNGYDVMAFSMPLYGLNSKPYESHQNFSLLESENFSPLSLFVEPVIVAINYAELEFDFDSVSMTGISGGGWTTTLAAAVDTRIEKSYPVAGSLPLRFKQNLSEGEYEDNHPIFVNNFSYEDLYFLGAYGKGRRQIQVLNKFDPCCFSAHGYPSFDDSVQKLGLKQLNARLQGGAADSYMTEEELAQFWEEGVDVLEYTFEVYEEHKGGKNKTDVEQEFSIRIVGTEKELTFQDTLHISGFIFDEYEDALQERLGKSRQGDQFSVYLDDSHSEHKISNQALTVFLEAEQE